MRKTKNKNYNSSDIKVLTDIEHVRKRTPIYLGSMHETGYDLPIFDSNNISIKHINFIPAVLKSFGEIVDNSIDEFSQIYSKRHKLVITANNTLGKYTISDNGRGIPIDMHDSGKYTPELALANLRSGRNFEDDKQAGVIGQNGVGSACVNFVSKEFKVKINRDNNEYTQIFENGCQFIGKPIIQKGPKKTGTSVSFTLDDTIFSNVSLPEELIREKCRALAFTNPSIEVQYNKESFKFKNGLEDIVSKFESNYFKFSTTLDNKTIEFFIIFGVNKNENEQVFTWVNSSLLFDGGSCNTQFLNAFTDKVIKHLEKEAKKQKCKVTRNDVKEKLLILGNIKISDPEFDSQSKTRLVGPSLRREMDTLISESWSQFTRKNKVWFEIVMENAHRRHHSRANTKAINDHQKINRKRVEGFKDASSKNRQECSVFICEGLSAAAEIISCRNPKIHASFALTGKINNVYYSTPAQLLQMGKITNMLTVLGLTPGIKATRANLNFGHIYMAVDADPDGNDICTLLVNIFYQFWPELFKFEIPIIHRLIVPNLVAYNKKERVYFQSMEDFKKVSIKYKNYEIVYYKGLGSMVKIDWVEILNNLLKYSVSITDDHDFKRVMTLLFSDDADARKKWLT